MTLTKLFCHASLYSATVYACLFVCVCMHQCVLMEYMAAYFVINFAWAQCTTITCLLKSSGNCITPRKVKQIISVTLIRDCREVQYKVCGSYLLYTNISCNVVIELFPKVTSKQIWKSCFCTLLIMPFSMLTQPRHLIPQLKLNYN